MGTTLSEWTLSVTRMRDGRHMKVNGTQIRVWVDISDEIELAKKWMGNNQFWHELNLLPWPNGIRPEDDSYWLDDMDAEYVFWVLENQHVDLDELRKAVVTNVQAALQNAGR